MKLTKLYLISFFAISIVATSCTEQSINGKWKLQQVDLMDVPNQKKRMTLDLSNPEKMKTDLYKESLPKELKNAPATSANHEIDSLDTSVDVNKVKADIDKWVTSTLQTSITLESGNKFYMKSNGLIVPTATAGWNFGDTLEGKWVKKNDTLMLSVGEDLQSYTWKFKVIQLSKKNLKLQELYDGFEGRGNELRFVRE